MPIGDTRRLGDNITPLLRMKRQRILAVIEDCIPQHSYSFDSLPNDAGKAFCFTIHLIHAHTTKHVELLLSTSLLKKDLTGSDTAHEILATLSKYGLDVFNTRLRQHDRAFTNGKAIGLIDSTTLVQHKPFKAPCISHGVAKPG